MSGDTLPRTIPRLLAPADLDDAFVEVCSWPRDPRDADARPMPHPSTIRVAIADDHPLVLTGLEHLLREHEGFDVVARCSTGAAALAAVDASRPDILLLDLQMPDMDGLAVLAALQARDPRPRVVLLTAGLNEDQLIEALRYDVRGVVLKEMAPTLLVAVPPARARRRSVAGEGLRPAARWRSWCATRTGTASSPRMLTPREIEIVRMVAQGLRNKVIAERLTISQRAP